MKKEMIWFVGLVVVVILLIGVYAKNYSNLKEYRNSINYSCQTVSDCSIKPILDCCGYFEKCINKDAIIDDDFVRESDCGKEAHTGCTTPSINYCSCENNKCVGKFNSSKFCEVYVPESREQCEKALNYGGNKTQNKTFQLSNGRKAEIKIMPETASEKAIARLGVLGFNVTLKEVGKGNETKAVYELTGNKQGKFLGIFKIMAKVSAQVDAETGEIVKVKRPWWAFLASGI